MSLDVLIQSVAVVLAASVPSAFGLLRMKKTALSVEDIRQQLLPMNGRRLAELAYDTQRDVAELRNQMVDLKFEVKNHLEGHRHTKKKTEPPTPVHDHIPASGLGAASVHTHSTGGTHQHNYSGGAASYGTTQPRHTHP